jgi:hypothetical protein
VHPYEKTYRSLQAVRNDRTVWTLPWPTRSSLDEIVVSQVGGAAVPFRVEIYNTYKVIDHSQSSGGPDEEGSYNPDPRNSQVGNTLDSTSPGFLRRLFDPALRYVNMDAVGPTNKRSLIYIEITPEGNDETSWDVTLRGATLS